MSPEELQRYLESLPDKVEQGVSKVLVEQAQELSDAQRGALRSLLQPPEETGHLEESIAVEVRGPLDVHVVAGGDSTTGDIREGSGVDYDHALAFEFGNSHQPARPFFYNTYRAKRDAINDAISDAINEAIKND
ncbi:MAG: HK97 gp10 family phage protein [Rhizobiales bacterium]|nr:HK97 gp10 family phage protein [Hyphomicrobiales bacterium]